MGINKPETTVPDSVTFHVITYTIEYAEYIRTGIANHIYRNVVNAADHYNVRVTERASGKLNVYITVHSIKAIETFTYLFHCMEFGYVFLIDMDKIVGTQVAMFPEEVDALKNADGTYSPPPVMRADQTLVIRNEGEKNNG
jgi:hypothetical protein